MGLRICVSKPRVYIAAIMSRADQAARVDCENSNSRFTFNHILLQFQKYGASRSPLPYLTREETYLDNKQDIRGSAPHAGPNNSITIAQSHSIIQQQ